MSCPTFLLLFLTPLHLRIGGLEGSADDKRKGLHRGEWILNIGHLRARKDLNADLAGKCKPLFIIREEKLDQLLIASPVLTDRTLI